MISLPCPYCPFSHKNSEEMRACWLGSVADASDLTPKKSTKQKFITSLPPSPAHSPSALSKNEKNIRAKKRKSNLSSAKRSSSSKNWSFKPKVTFESLEIDTNSFYVNSDLSVTRKPVSQPTERNTNFDSMRPQKGEFVCQKCIQRKSFVTFGPSPKCRGCNSNEQTTPLCRRCKNPFTFWRQEHQWICRSCSDIRDVSREAASGQRSDITPLRQTRKGKKILLL